MALDILHILFERIDWEIGSGAFSAANSINELKQLNILMEIIEVGLNLGNFGFEGDDLEQLKLKKINPSFLLG